MNQLQEVKLPNQNKLIPNKELKLLNQRLLTVEQVAIYTGMKERTIRDYVYKGKIPYIKINKMVRFDRAKIDQWIDEFYRCTP